MAEELVDALGDDLSGMSGVPRGMVQRPALIDYRQVTMPYREILRRRSRNVASGIAEKLQGNFQALADALPDTFIGPGRGATIRLNPELAAESSRIIPFVGRLNDAVAALEGKGDNKFLEGIKKLTQEQERGLQGTILGKRRIYEHRKELSRIRGLLTSFHPEDIGYIIHAGLGNQQNAPKILVQDAYKMMALLMSGLAPPEAATMDMVKTGVQSARSAHGSTIEAALGRRAVDLGLETLRPDGRLSMGMRQPEGVMRLERGYGTGAGKDVRMFNAVGLESPRSSATEYIPSSTVADPQLSRKPRALSKRGRVPGFLEPLRLVAEEDIERARNAQELLAKKTGKQAPLQVKRLINSFAQIISGPEISYQDAQAGGHAAVKEVMARMGVTEVTPEVLKEFAKGLRKVADQQAQIRGSSRGEKEAMMSTLRAAEDKAYMSSIPKGKRTKVRAPSKLTEALLPDVIAEDRLLSKKAIALLRGDGKKTLEGGAKKLLGALGRISKGTVPMLAASAFAAGLMTLGLAGGGDEA